jgi:hypothetical protein
MHSAHHSLHHEASDSGGYLPDEPELDFEIGVCDEGFNVFAKIIMRGADGVRRIESDLAGMGYESVTIGTSEQLHGCDLLMVRKPVAPALGLR